MSCWKEGSGIEASHLINTPIATDTRPDTDEPGSSLNQTMHRDVTESLLYFTASRPDIMLRVGFCARSHSNPNDSHRKAGVRILRYLRGTQDLHPAVLKCCGPRSKLEELESNSRGTNKVTTEDQVADIFTKSPGKKAF
ncbi:PREDICTED: uncharacterized protein LOC109210129 [Nicotiana attenuata]|uniref:uncharacterized protein LOC109210129 n=1 Tax=Nicotiana attenuata TaxID=49451 RepID=UPI000905D538|nr:PREDICTED: uncharacterized protein LOC109210129 [Nicotiana attenuata]